MKKLNFIVLVLLFSSTISSFAIHIWYSNSEEIVFTSTPIKTKDDSGSTNEPGLPIKRSIPHSIVYGYLCNKMVTLNFNDVLENANIVITNNRSGAVVYEEACSQPTSLTINLSGEGNGEYLIEIETDNCVLCGYFSF